MRSKYLFTILLWPPPPPLPLLTSIKNSMHTKPRLDTTTQEDDEDFALLPTVLVLEEDQKWVKNPAAGEKCFDHFVDLTQKSARTQWIFSPRGVERKLPGRMRVKRKPSNKAEL